jgi:hypothetical protein
MNILFNDFKSTINEFGINDDIINMYLVFMGVRSACLITDFNRFYLMPKQANLEIYFGRYPGYGKKFFDYPLVCLKDSLVSKSIQSHTNEFSEPELGLYLGFNCFNQDWMNLKINRYAIRYSLVIGKEYVSFYDEVCSKPPDLGMLARIKFKAKEMTAALKMINPRYVVKHEIEFLPKLVPKKKTTTV